MEMNRRFLTLFNVESSEKRDEICLSVAKLGHLPIHSNEDSRQRTGCVQMCPDVCAEFAAQLGFFPATYDGVLVLSGMPCAHKLLSARQGRER